MQIQVHRLLFCCNDYSKPKANQEINVFVRDDYSCHGSMSSHQFGCKYKYNGFFPHVTSTVSTGFPRTIATALVLVLPARWVSQSVRSLNISWGRGWESIQCLTFKTWKSNIFPLVVSPRGTSCTFSCEEHFWKNESDGRTLWITCIYGHFFFLVPQPHSTARPPPTSVKGQG